MLAIYLVTFAEILQEIKGQFSNGPQLGEGFLRERKFKTKKRLLVRNLAVSVSNRFSKTFRAISKV